MKDSLKMAVCGSVMDGVLERGEIPESPTKKVPTEYKVYPVRWFVLFIFTLYSASNAMQWIQYSIIQDSVVKYYGVTSNSVYWTSMVYMLAYIPLIFPASYLLDKTNLRVTTIIGAVANCAGSWLKVASVRQDLFWLSFLGQTILAVGQVFVLSIPPRLAAVWFGADQVSSACSIGVFGNQLGIAVGFLITPMIVRVEGSIEQLSEDFKFLFYLVAGITTVLLVLIVFFFKAKPKTPPSAAADLGSAIPSNFFQSLKSLICNRNYMLLLVSYGIIVGVSYAYSTLLNELVLKYHPGANEDAGRIGLVMVIAGMVGAILGGVIIDKTHWFKQTALVVYAASCAGILVITFVLSCEYLSVLYVCAGLVGFFMTGYLSIGLEFASEVTYPEPEGTTSGLMNASAQVFGIILTLLLEWMLDGLGDRWADLIMTAILGLGIVITAFIQSDLRRKNAEKNAANA